MSDEATAGGDELPVVDDVLTAALEAQGAAGVRVLALLRDARTVLAGASFLQRSDEVAESCLRGAADALLSLPGSTGAVGLAHAARGLLGAVDAVRSPAGRAVPEPAWDRVDTAAEVLRAELDRPGRYHQGRAAGVAERLMGVKLGFAQDKALDVWSQVYHATSGTLHGAAAEAGRPARLYAEVLAAARELLVPLPGRAARVLDLTALTAPGPGDALELARWADPRATAFFFRSRPAPAWLGLLQDHAPHLLLPDAQAGGTWPAAEFLTHVATADPPAARAWLTAHAQESAAAGRPALDAVLRLAARDEDLIAPSLVREVLVPRPDIEPGGPEGPAEGWTLRLAAEWACTVPPEARDGDWIVVAELLLKTTVEAEHTAARYRRTPAEQALTAAQPIYVSASPMLRVLLSDPADWAQAARAESARMPDRLTGRLLGELVASAHPPAGAHPRVRMIRAVLANLLATELKLTDPAARRIVFHQDLEEVRLQAPAAFGGPRLARALLDLAAADADADVDLTERTGRWKKVADVDKRLYRRLLAAHLTDRPPHEEPHTTASASGAQCPTPDHSAPATAAAGDAQAGQWRSAAHTLVPLLLAAGPDPEPARLAAAVWAADPPHELTALEEAARAALGAPPASHEIDAVLPDTPGPVDGTREPLASWLRVWDWSPVLPERLCTGFEPLFAVLARRRPQGPADPRTAVALVPVRATTVVNGQDLVELAATQGPPAAAQILTTEADGADDADTVAYADLLNRLVAATPAAWTADVPAVLAELGLPVLRVSYLAAAAAAAHRPNILPQDNLSHALHAALRLRRALPAAAPGARRAPVGPDGDRIVLLCADEAVFGLLTEAWQRPACLAEGLLPTALAHLHALAEQLTRPAHPPIEDATPPEEAVAAVPDPAVRALDCLLDYAESRTRTGAPMPDTVLDLLADVLAARPREKAVSAVIGPRLPALHRHAPAFAAAHRPALTGLDGPSPAAAWLALGPADPQLLLTLDRTILLAAPRRGVGGLVEHLAHALTTDPHHLGDPGDVLAEIAAGPDGPGTVSWLLQVLAWRLDPGWSVGAAGVLRFPRTVLQPPTGTELAAVTTLWRAALAADLPPGALAGAGYFAHLPLDDDVWLPLARASAEHTPPDSPDTAAERAATHPDSQDALVLTALLVARPTDPWAAHTVLPHAHTLFRDAVRADSHAHPDAVVRLREALINAGELDLARPPTETG